MTKSPRSATKKHPLANLFRWLAVLCFIKLSIFAMILLDFPFPALFDKESQVEEKKVEAVAQKPVDPPKEDLHAAKDTAPQKAAEPASASAPLVQKATQESSYVPAFLPEEKADATPHKEASPEDAPLFSQKDLPLPKPLPAPIAEPGKLPPDESKQPTPLPVPTLGSVTAAHAAASMPVPQAGPSNSPFAPVEQNAPLTRPGVPDIPAKPQQRSMPAASLAPNARPQPQIPVPGKTGNLSSNTEAQELARQQQDILMLKKQMDERLKELQDSEAKVKRMLEQAKGVEDQRMRTLIQMYANMKPKTAAKALESMDERTACQILQRMTPKQSGDILSYTNPAVTAKLTEMLTRLRGQ